MHINNIQEGVGGNINPLGERYHSQPTLQRLLSKTKNKRTSQNYFT